MAETAGRLGGEAPTREERLLAALEACCALTAAEPSLDRLLQTLAQRGAEVARARLAAAAILEPGGTAVELLATHGGDEDERVALAALVRASPTGPVPARAPFAGLLRVPIGAHGHLWAVDAAAGAFAPEDEELARILAAHAAAAVDLAERVRRDSLRLVVEAQEAERRRIARELHDQTGQSLASVLFAVRELGAARDAAAARRAAEAVTSLVTEALEDVRRLALELRPQLLDDFGLAPALERLVERFAERTGIDAELTAPPDADARLPSEHETVLYRAAQEALTNVARHAGAARVRVSLERRPDGLELAVADDGRGFDAAVEGRGSFGLGAMRERLALAGGSLRVETRPGAGTTVRAVVPGAAAAR